MAEYVIADLTETMHRIYTALPVTAQFTRQGRTLRWFNPRASIAYKGKRMEYKTITGAPSAARGVPMATARLAGYEFPAAYKLTAQECSYDYDDLTLLHGSVELNDLAEEFTDDKAAAIFNIATRCITDAGNDAKVRGNQMMHQDTTATMATAASAALQLDGTACSSTTTAYIPIDGGSIAMFEVNQAVAVRAAGDASTIRVAGYVKEVCPDRKGPWYGGDRASAFDNTVGIVVKYDATLTTAVSGTDTAFDNVADGDEIVLAGEGDYGTYGLPAWFDPTVNCIFDGDGSAINRDDGEHGWTIPWIYDWGVSGTPADIDMEEIFQDLADFLPDQVAVGTSLRKGYLGGGARDEGIFLDSSLLAVGRPELLNDSASDGRESVQLTSVAASGLSEAEKKHITNVVGARDSAVYFSPTLGHVVLGADPVCTPERLYILNPQSWAYLTLKGGINAMNWIKDNGSMWHRITGTNNRLTFERVAGWYTGFLPFCDQPKSNVMVRYVQSSRRT